MSCNITNNLCGSSLGLPVLASSFSIAALAAFDREPNNALKSLTPFAGTAFRRPLA